jgi:competence protein ComEA
MLNALCAVIAVLLFSVRLAFAAVDINTATAEDLDRLKGIGPVKAKAIVEYRAKNGPFKSIEDIKKVAGISDATFQTIKSDITVNTQRVKKPAEDKRGAEAGRKDRPGDKDAKIR